MIYKWYLSVNCFNKFVENVHVEFQKVYPKFYTNYPAH